MIVPLAAGPPKPTMRDRILAGSAARILLATIAVVAPVAIILVATHALIDKSMRFAWPQLLATIACVFGYRLYVSVIERRSASEIAVADSARDLGVGLLIGSGLLLTSIGFIALAGDYSIVGKAPISVTISPLVEMVLVATFEEILFRGIVFRLIERSWGTWVGLVLSSAIFAAAHLPNDGISLLSVAFTFVAGLTLATAYIATRRLWLPIGIHFAWNFMSDAIFSLPTSGHPANGYIQGRMTGPDWLTGGHYGLEGSAVALALFVLVALILLATSKFRQPQTALI